MNPYQVLSSIRAIFPTLEIYEAFVQHVENKEIIQSIRDFAVRFHIVDENDVDPLPELIERHALKTGDADIPQQVTFEQLFERKSEILGVNLSVRALTERINTLLTEYSIRLPKISNSMLTRLKKEPADTAHKQNTLRSLAFWIGLERSELVESWHFGALLKLCGESKQAINYREGVRIGFSLYGRGDVIGHETVGYLRKELKNYIEEAAGRYCYARWGKVKSHDITTLYVDIPKETEIGNPMQYLQCLRIAVSLAHQMAIRWALSQHFSQHRFLSIAIAAGDFSNLDNYILPLLNAKLPGDPVIRMTDFTRQCIMINNIKAIFCSQPQETILFNGEDMSIWWVVGVWSTIYFDFVPDLLADPLLGSGSEVSKMLAEYMWFPVNTLSPLTTEKAPNAIDTFFKFPHNMLLGMEIAKVLFYRRKFREALEVLRIIISIYPAHLSARTLRMIIFRNLAVDAESFPIAESFFRQAELESRFIRENCDYQAEDFFCELACMYLAQSITILQHMRAMPGIHRHSPDFSRYKKRVLEAMSNAETYFEYGLTISASAGIRSIYLLSSLKIIYTALHYDEQVFTDPDRPIDAPFEVTRQKMREYHVQLGFIREPFDDEEELAFLYKAFTASYAHYDDSISLKAYRPATYFCTAVSLWDMFPVRTAAIARRTLYFLNGAIDLANEVEDLDVCIYSFTRTYGEVLPTREFISHVQNAIRKVEACAGPNLTEMSDDVEIATNGPISEMIMTLNV